MTVNKAQGQTIPNVGIFLPEPVFSHGQLYVALTRATARQHVKVLAYPADHASRKKQTKSKAKDTSKGKKKRVDEDKERASKSDGRRYTKNIVYREVLTS